MSTMPKLQNRLNANYTVHGIAFASDNSFLACVSDELRIWRIPGSNKAEVLSGHEKAAVALALFPNGKMAVSGDYSSLHLWDLSKHKMISQAVAHTSWIYSISLSRSAKRIATLGNDGLLKVWDAASLEVLQKRSCAKLSEAAVFDCDENQLVIGSGSQLEILSVDDLQPLRVLGRHRARIRSLAFSPDYHYLASGSYDSTVKIWQMPNGTDLCTLKGHSLRVWSLSFSPDGNRLASAGGDGTVRIWDVNRREQLFSLNVAGGIVFSVAFSANGKMLAAGGEGGLVHLWNCDPG